MKPSTKALGLGGMFGVLFLLSGCTTSLKQKQDDLSSRVKSPLLERLYTTDLYSVYYDKAIKQCVLFAYLNANSASNMSIGVGTQVFSCNPTDVKKISEEHPYVEEKGGLNGFTKALP